MDERAASSGGDHEEVLFRPGEVVQFSRSTSASPAAQPADNAPVAAANVDSAAPPAAAAEPPEPAPATPPEQLSVAGAATARPTPPRRREPAGDEVTWTASEFIAHHKSTNWYAALAGAALVTTVVVWLLTRDIFLSALVLIGVIILGVYAGRNPRQLTYHIDRQGLTVGNHHYGFKEFRSFSVVPDGAFAGIELAPLRRFATYMTVYYDPADEAAIVALLSQHLPMELPHGDITERLMRRIHF